jgi:SNF2 family DNA or RNA helicase
MLYLVGKALARENIKSIRVDGTQNLAERKKALHSFQNDSETSVLLISIGSGGVG